MSGTLDVDVAALAGKYVGLTSAVETACEPVEAGAVRRYAQAIGDLRPDYRAGAEASEFGGPIAPALFPTWMFRRGFDEADPLVAHAGDPDFDGVGAPSAQGLPPIVELGHYATLNAGTEVEFLRYANHGDRVTMTSRYAEITSRQTSRGWIVLVVIESDYRTGAGDLLLRVRRTGIRRPIPQDGE